MTEWPLAASVEDVRRRYDRLAPLYRLALLLFLVPPRIRRRAVERLELQPSESVLEVGCGSGANLDLLATAVGAGGEVIGVDVSRGMLARARHLVERRGWSNVTLVEEDAEQLSIAGPVDAVFFGLSYAVIPEPRRALREAWARLRPGGRIVIVEGYLPDDIRGRILRPVVRALSAATVLGEVDRRPWDDLAELTHEVATERFQFGLYVITRARKPARR
jgi:ubiquinone/menaquinone biosynthesis C-methylase UbiE